MRQALVCIHLAHRVRALRDRSGSSSRSGSCASDVTGPYSSAEPTASNRHARPTSAPGSASQEIGAPAGSCCRSRVARGSSNDSRALDLRGEMHDVRRARIVRATLPRRPRGRGGRTTIAPALPWSPRRLPATRSAPQTSMPAAGEPRHEHATDESAAPVTSARHHRLAPHRASPVVEDVPQRLLERDLGLPAGVRAELASSPRARCGTSRRPQARLVRPDFDLRPRHAQQSVQHVADLADAVVRPEQMLYTSPGLPFSSASQ